MKQLFPLFKYRREKGRFPTWRGMDLSLFHSHPILDTDAEGINPRPLRPQFVEVANMILAKAHFCICASRRLPAQHLAL